MRKQTCTVDRHFTAHLHSLRNFASGKAFKIEVVWTFWHINGDGHRSSLLNCHSLALWKPGPFNSAPCKTIREFFSSHKQQQRVIATLNS